MMMRRKNYSREERTTARSSNDYGNFLVILKNAVGAVFCVSLSRKTHQYKTPKEFRWGAGVRVVKY
jgi:hypothetical protein